MRLSRLLRKRRDRPREPSPPRVVSVDRDLPADISFMIADTKYSRGRLKFLEFGQGQLSGFHGYYGLHDEHHPWLGFWRYVAQFSLPVGLLTTEVLSYKTRHVVRGACERHVENVDVIQGPDEFDGFVQRRREGDAGPPPRISDRRRINAYRGLFMKVFRHKSLGEDVRGDDPEAARSRIDAFKTRLSGLEAACPDFLLLNRATSVYTARKDAMAALFNTDSLRELLPKARTYSTTYSADLAERIRSEIGADVVVIKPLDSSRGQGVIMVPWEELDQTLGKILNKDPGLEQEDRGYSYWLADSNDEFMVQSYETSKTIEIENRPYDATMRVIFSLHHDQGQLTVQFHDCFWKLPKSALDEDVPLTQRTRSFQTRSRLKSGEVLSARVNDRDASEVRDVILDAMPSLYESMLVAQATDSD